MGNKELCVVVGAGPGIGLAVARRFAREGYRLALLARRADALQTQVDDLRANGAEADGYAVNVANFEALRSTFDTLTARAGSPAVLVYNAAAVTPALPSQLEGSRLQEELAVSITGALVSAQQVIPQMIVRGKGTILLTGGGFALHPSASMASLSIGKAGIRSLAYSLAEELEPKGIHAATVTVAGWVKPGTAFDPDRIAQAYWKLHVQPGSEWKPELLYDEAYASSQTSI